MTEKHKIQQLKKEYSGLVDYAYGYTFARVGNVHDAEDIVSGVFIECLSNINRFDPEKGSLRQFITGMLRFRIIDYFRAKKPQVDLEAVVNILQVQEKGLSATCIDQRQLVEEILDSVPPDIRGLLFLRYVDDMTYKQIAELIGKKPAAVRQIFSRLHKNIQTNFQEYAETLS